MVKNFFYFKECSNGTYVSHGKCVKCQGVCTNDTPCNISTGRCDDGCSDHWAGFFCEGILIILYLKEAGCIHISIHEL